MHVKHTDKICHNSFDSRRYQIFWEVVGLEQGPLSLVSTTEELLGKNSGDSGLEIREYGRGDSSRWLRGTLQPQKVSNDFADKRRWFRSVQFAHGLRPRSLVSFLVMQLLQNSVTQTVIREEYFREAVNEVCLIRKRVLFANNCS
jgi:hypothetical protein